MIKEHRMYGNVITVESPIDAETSVIWSAEHDAFLMKFKIARRWYFQWLCWSCRAGRAKYYKALVDLYRHVRYHQLSEKPLRVLAR